MSFADTIQDTAKDASARIADTAQGAAKVAGKRVSSGYGQALDLVMTGVKLIPSVSAALGLIGLQKKKSNALGTSLSFGAGLLLGTGAGILFAPKSGSELRQTILGYLSGTPLEKTANDLSNKAQAAVHSVSDKAQSVAHTVGDKAQAAAHTVGDKAQAAVHTAGDKLEGAKNDLKGGTRTVS